MAPDLKPPLTLRLLGTARVRVDSDVELPTRKALALIAYLAVAGPASRARLASLLWSDQSDDDARRNLRQEVHRLHTSAAGEWIEAHGEELALRAGADIDVVNFHSAIAIDDDTAAVELYGGEFLTDLQLRGAAEFDIWLAGERESLARHWRAALARQARRREDVGDPKGALDALRALLREDPLQESGHRDAMRLLSLLGQRESALAQFEQCRELLRTHLGVEPTAETLALAQRIRLAEPVRETSGTEPVLAALRPPLVGRDEAWAQLAAAGRRLALVECEPGLGKSRLIGEFAAAQGKVLALKGREISGGTPFYPVAEALLQAYSDDPSWFELIDPVWRMEVARLVPALADDAAPGALPVPDARGRFLEGLAIALLTAAGGGSLLFDDLQWFDSSSAELVAHVVRRAHRVRLFAATRSEELAANASVQAALAAIDRDGLLLRVPLEPLTGTDVLMLVRALSGSSGATVFSRRLHAATAGNPLFIMETLRDLFSAGVLWRDRGTWSTPYDDETEDYRELPISPSVREAVLRRIDRLGEGPRQLLEAASVAGDGFELEWISGCTSLSEWEQVDALERAVHAQVLAPLGKGYRFAHDLMRRSLVDAMNPERARLLHRRLAATLATLDAAPAEIALHLEAGGRPREAIDYRVRAAEAAGRVYAQREAIAHYDAALADGIAGPAAFAVHSARIEVFRNVGEEEGRTQALAAMAGIAATLDEPALAAELAIKRTVHAFERGAYAEGLAVAASALEGLRGRIDDVTEASLLLEIGATLKALGRVEEARAHLLDAIARFRDLSPLKVANCAYWLCQCEIDLGDLAAARSFCETAVTTTREVGYRRGHALALAMRADLAWRQGDAQGALEDLETALREAREIGSLPLQRGFIALLIERALARGDGESAQRWQLLLDELPH